MCSVYRGAGYVPAWILKVSEDRDYLEHADGTPFFWLGDTHWTFVTEERFDESNCPRYDSQFKACVDKRVAQKFTVYQCNFRDGKVGGYFGQNLDLMHETDQGFVPDVKQFQENVDRKMKYLADAGLLIAVGYAWGYDMPNGGVERYKKMAKYTMARYGAYPVAWTLAGELPGYMGDLDENVRLWNEVAKECASWNIYGNLQSVHLAWYDGLEMPGADQLTIFRDFYESVGWSRLKPLTKENAETKSFFMEAGPAIRFSLPATVRCVQLSVT